MEEQSPGQATATENKQIGNRHGHLRKIALLEVGIIEVLFVIAAIVLFFALLNYFNIVSLSRLYPQQFGWLPHLPLAAENATQNSGNTVKSGRALHPNEPILKPSTPVAPDVIRKDMQSFAKQSLKPSLILPSFSIKPSTGPNGTILDPNRFNAFWSLPDGTFVNISARYGQKATPQDRNALLALPQLIANISATSANIITDKYFIIKTKGTWDCSKQTVNKKEITRCLNLWTDKNVKKEIDVIFLVTVAGKDSTSLSYCERYPDSFYYSWKSCNFQK